MYENMKIICERIASRAKYAIYKVLGLLYVNRDKKRLCKARMVVRMEKTPGGTGLRLCAPCLFGLEGPLGNELRHMGMSSVAPENGRVFFETDEYGLARANIGSRFAERILLELGSFRARSFEELFEGVRALSLEDWLPRDAAFPVKGWSLESQLHSVPDCQRIIKKAAAVRLGAAWGLERLPETGALCQIQFSIMKDLVHVYLDTSGTSLHKRGYRPAQVAAPLRETLAAAMVDISGYRGRGEFCDPFCGSGTIAIEAALAAKGRAPGINRSFAAEKWPVLRREIWREAREAARAREYSGEYRISASDIDPRAVELARANAERAGVAEIVRFSVADAREFSRSTERGVIVTNPPYGERMLEKREAERLYSDFGKALAGVSGWELYLLSSHTELERCLGRSAQKRRRLYNGTLRCELYIYRRDGGSRR